MQMLSQSNSMRIPWVSCMIHFEPVTRAFVPSNYEVVALLCRHKFISKAAILSSHGTSSALPLVWDVDQAIKVSFLEWKEHGIQNVESRRIQRRNYRRTWPRYPPHRENMRGHNQNASGACHACNCWCTSWSMWSLSYGKFGCCMPSNFGVSILEPSSVGFQVKCWMARSSPDSNVQVNRSNPIGC
jgi:hypothetical protein